MQLRRLGRTGLRVSAVGFGGIPIMGRSPVGAVSEEEAVRIIRYALDRDINFIDTARSYGESERRIGLAVQGRSPRWWGSPPQSQSSSPLWPKRATGLLPVPARRW